MKNIVLLWTLLIGMFSLSLSAQNLENIDEIAPFSDGLAAIRKGKQWGFINEEGTLVINFRDDVYWNKTVDSSRTDILGIAYPMFNEGLCIITKTVEDGVPLLGYMDKTGTTVIEPQFLNIFPFKNGLATGVLLDKTIKGENEFKLQIYEYKFFDVLFTTSGEITDYFEKRDNIQMTIKRYETPKIGAKILANGLVAVEIPTQGWQIRKL